MPDVVVTVPKDWWTDWLDEGALPGEPIPEGVDWYDFYLVRGPSKAQPPLPDIEPGERVYVVAHGRLRGYAPLVRIDERRRSLVREDGAVACTIDEPIRGFRGWRYRWWNREDERPFPEWQTEGVE